MTDAVTTDRILLQILRWGEEHTLNVSLAQAEDLIERLESLLAIKPPRRQWTRWTEDQIAELRRRHANGESVPTISKAMDIPRRAISSKIERLELSK